MRDPSRIPKILTLLEMAWDMEPDCRLGQLLLAIVSDPDRDLFYIEEDEWERLLRSFICDDEGVDIRLKQLELQFEEFTLSEPQNTK